MATTRSKRILVVDDSPTILKILSRGIASLGYEVYQATNGLNALKLIAEKPVDLILTDINMPELDGYGLIAKIREIPQLKALPIIVLTSEKTDSSMGKALDAGANLYLMKPASLPKLKYKVQSLLGESVEAIPDTDKGVSATLTESKEAAEVLERVRAYREANERIKKVSAEIQIEMCIFAETHDEAEMIMNILVERDDLFVSDVLPLLMDESFTNNELIRLLRLMARMKKNDFAVPLIHLYQRNEDFAVRAELVKAIGHCGGKDFIADLEELYRNEAAMTVKLDEGSRLLLNAFDQAIDVARDKED